ncbi:MAG: DUF1127 domain-containing protein [Defluviimonas sp.]|nr:DUF1127 domain-containing protein [Defluviimonas sp.]
MAFATHIRSAEHGLADRVAAVFHRVHDARRRGKVFRQTLAELGGLSARELADIGIHRSMITRVAAEAAYGAKR